MKFSLLRFIMFGFCALLSKESLFAAEAITRQAENSPRVVTNINRDYRFTFGDVTNAEKADFNDSGWSNVSLPHSFSTPFFLSDQKNCFYVGQGWYRKTLTVPAEWKGKRISVEFEGAFQETEVFFNGKFIGRHKGGYTGFSLDCTDVAVIGNNLLSVRVNNFWNPELAPRAGGHYFSGGIYRDVHLVATDPVHVTWYGTFVTTPTVSKEQAVVAVKTEIRNDSNAAVNGILKNSVVAPDGTVVSRTQSPLSLPPQATIEQNQSLPSFKNPLLWHPDHPHLYTAVTEIFDNAGKLRDRYETRFGVRWIEFTADRGFFINGEHYYLRGANVHQDRAGWGIAATNAAFHRDVKMIKDSGMNFIRGCHYPHDPAFADACDEKGILFWSEGVFWGLGGFTKDADWDSSAYPPEAQYQAGFEDSCEQTLREMIRIHRNHPSIITWSVGNEMFFTDSAVMDNARKLVSRLVKAGHEADPTRPVAVGGCQRGNFDKLGDIAGYNGDGARLFINPGIANLVSEYGSVVAERPGNYNPNRHELQETEFPWRSGQCIWSGFHYGMPGWMGKMGMIDYFRLPLRTWYWYRNEYLKIPPPVWPVEGTAAALKLETSKASVATDGTDDCQLTVTVLDANGQHISNAPDVTLEIISGPGILPTGRNITFKNNSNIRIADGQAAIDLRAYHAGKTIVRATSPGIKAAELEITSTGDIAYVEGKTTLWQPVAGPLPEVAKAKTAGKIDIARNRPTMSSSAKSDHRAEWGNDGNPDTGWAAATIENGQAWWQVDLENFYSVDLVIILRALSAPVQVQVSEDGNTWKTIGTASSKADILIIPCNAKDTYGRFLRIMYDKVPSGGSAGHANVEAHGVFGR